MAASMKCQLSARKLLYHKLNIVSLKPSCHFPLSVMLHTLAKLFVTDLLCIITIVVVVIVAVGKMAKYHKQNKLKDYVVSYEL